MKYSLISVSTCLFLGLGDDSVIDVGKVEARDKEAFGFRYRLNVSKTTQGRALPICM